MKFWKQSVLFYLGGGGYVTLELLWRGRSHGSMFVLGGVCFLMIGRICRWLRRTGILVKTVIGAIMVTFMELLTGLTVNRNHTIWDYRGLPLNFRGQISLVYFLLWLPVSFLGMILFQFADRRIGKKA